MTASRSTARMLTASVAALIAMGVAGTAAVAFGFGSRSGGAIVAGTLVAVLSAAAVLGRRHGQQDRTG